MYRFIIANEVPFPFTLHTQYPAGAIAIDTSGIECYRECLIHVLPDNEDCISDEALESLWKEVYNILCNTE